VRVADAKRSQALIRNWEEEIGRVAFLSTSLIIESSSVIGGLYLAL